jgi:hypothetical protein
VAGLGGRLFVAADETVRTMPGGVVVGEVGDSHRVLTGSAHALAADGDVCVDRPVAAALRAADHAELAGYLVALDALRLMLSRTKVVCRVSGLGFRIAERAMSDEAGPPRTDLLLLSSADGHVLFDARAHRGFKISPGMAEILDVVLHTTRPETVLDRLGHCPNVPGDPAQAADAVRAELHARGVDLPEPVFAGGPR